MQEREQDGRIVTNQNSLDMKSKNHVSLIGIVGRDAEYRQTQQGAKYTRFTLATSTGGYKRADGSAVPEVTQWHQIVCWDKMAEYAAQFIKKGMKVAVDGQIAYNEFTDQQGVKRTATDIVCRDFCLMQKPQQATQQATQQAQQTMAQQTTYQQPQQVQQMPQGAQQPQQTQQASSVPGMEDLPF